MIERLSVLCFAGTYMLALAADLARVVLGARPRWALTLALTLLGWLVHTAYLANLGWRTHELPISTVFSSLLVLAWILVAIDLYLLVHAPKGAAVSVFVLPIALALLALATGMPASAREEWTIGGGWVTVWGTLHGVLLLGGSVAMLVAFAAGLMYLLQAQRLKTKRPARFGFTLPSLEQSERWNRLAIATAFPLLTFGLLIGVALNVASQRGGARLLSWTDPKVLSTLALWAMFAFLLHAREWGGWRGRRVMVLTAVATAFLVFALVGVDLLLPTAHGVPRDDSAPATAVGGRLP